MGKFTGLVIISSAAAFIGSGGYTILPDVSQLGPLTQGAACDIKGNVSINTGERIYHVRGQEHYDETIISPQYGERWFCSESEAHAAGWRKARR
jgi:hypothetical protein